jgi:ATP/maltotriose-dependent transcriptional regulator MalT
VAELAARTRVATVGLFAAGGDVLLAIVDGHLNEALELIRRYLERANASGAPIRGRIFAATLLMAAPVYLGRPEDWLSTFDEPAALADLARLSRGGVNAGLFIRSAERAICLAQLGRLAEAQAVVGPLLNDLDGRIDDESRIAALVMLRQAAVAVEHQAAANALADRLASMAHLTGETRFGYLVARHLGNVAALLGDCMAARLYYAQALESAGKIRFRPELALTHPRLAELLLEEGDDPRSEALEHLDAAIPKMQKMHVRPRLERGLALRQKLTAAAALEPARQSGSDALTVREREIASLMANGLSNHDISVRLVITEGTVDFNVKHILGKLGFRSRAQVAGWVARQGPGEAKDRDFGGISGDQHPKRELMAQRAQVAGRVARQGTALPKRREVAEF